MLINNNDIKLLLKVAFAGVIVFLVHGGLLYLWPDALYRQDILIIHPFVLSLTILTIVAVNIIFRKAKAKFFGYVYMASGLVKMFIAIGFLLPVISSNSDFKLSFVLQFFSIYFIYLILEVYYLARYYSQEK